MIERSLQREFGEQIVNVTHVKFYVEERSMEEALRILLPRVLGQLTFEIHSFLCKSDLLAKMPSRLRGCHRWLPSDCRIVVIVDRDDDDCRGLKRQMEQISSEAGLVTKSVAAAGTYAVLNRIAIEELEAWYFGDWQAVRKAYPRVPETIPRKSAYRNPDAIQGGTWEAFERVLKKAGYFRSGLRKIEAARKVARHLNPDRNSSASFCALCDALREMVP